MDDVRRSLHAKFDALLDEVFHEHQHSDDTYLQIEACIIKEQRTNSTGGYTNDSVTKKMSERIDIKRWQGVDSLVGTQPMPSVTSSGLSVASKTRSHDDRQTSRSNGRGQRSPDTSSMPASTSHHQSDNSMHKVTGGLRLSNQAADTGVMYTPPRTPTPPTSRQIDTDDRQFPKRRKVDKDGPAKLEQSTVDKLIEGIWEQIHRSQSLALGQDLKITFETIINRVKDGSVRMGRHVDFEDASKCCQQVTAGSRTMRSLEVIVQAHWVDCYDGRIASLAESRTDLKTYEVRKIVMTEACSLFRWSEKELRNRMSIWKGYREIKNAAGWAALVFSGPGVYRFCKYRLGFDQEALSKLESLKTRIEVAADTLHPQWRQLLSLVGESTQLHWRGHPHDWVVSKKADPVPVAFTYRQSDPHFTFTHLQESIIDKDAWGEKDPRRLSFGPEYVCSACLQCQSLSAETNKCECFPDLFGPNARSTQPVQVFRTDNGRNNGLLACCTFPRGTAVGEFVGLVTKGLSNLDVMQSQVPNNSEGSVNEPYQISQNRHGNYTRFINHSCQPNCQFQAFTWLGIQRILVISKGVPARKEITVNYSSRYWQHLDKKCLCGEPKCRYDGATKSMAGHTRSNSRSS